MIGLTPSLSSPDNVLAYVHQGEKLIVFGILSQENGGTHQIGRGGQLRGAWSGLPILKKESSLTLSKVHSPARSECGYPLSSLTKQYSLAVLQNFNITL